MIPVLPSSPSTTANHSVAGDVGKHCLFKRTEEKTALTQSNLQHDKQQQQQQ
jgi:hypothetical protein